jgi:putative methionine-R-sulfoxide reductase with GAF domain
MRDPVLNWSEALFVVSLRRDGRILEANEPIERFAGRTLSGSDISALVPEAGGAELQRLLAAQGPTPGVLALSLDGETVSERRVLAQPEGEHVLLVAEPPVEDLRRLLARAMEMNADLIELRAQLQHANERLRYLESVGAVALIHRDLKTVLGELLRLMCNMLGGDEATVLLLHPEKDVLVIESALGRPDEVGFQVPVGQGVSGRIAASGEPLVVDDLVEMHPIAPLLAERGGSLVGVPLRAGGRLIGVAHVTSAQRGRFNEQDVGLLQLVADRAALAIDNVRAYEREQQSSLTLQRSLLPTRLPDVPSMELAARYLPASDQVQVGGDWFDAIALPDGRLGLAIGDVAGRGLMAATMMGRLSNALRAYALEHSSPGAVLERLNRLAYEEEVVATAAYVVLDPRSGSGVFASSGHLPPLIRSGGDVQLLPRAGAPPLGADLRPVPDVEIEMPAGADLLLYTDGLVELRGEAIDDGLERLRRIAGRQMDGPGELCDLLVEKLVGERAGEDDVAVVAARRATLE